MWSCVGSSLLFGGPNLKDNNKTVSYLCSKDILIKLTLSITNLASKVEDNYLQKNYLN
jgi:hypothetical protein